MRAREQTDILGIATFGLFLLLVGVIVAVTPDILDRAYDFFRDFRLRELAPNVYLPAPRSDDMILYTAVFQFCLAFAILQVPILGARFILKDSVDRKAGTVSSLFFWFGAAWITNLLIAKDIDWFAFFGYLIALLGTSLIIKNAISLVAQALRKS